MTRVYNPLLGGGDGPIARGLRQACAVCKSLKQMKITKKKVSLNLSVLGEFHMV